MDWTHVLTIATVIGGAAWALSAKLGAIRDEVAGLRLDLTLKMQGIEGRVIKLEEAKAARRVRR